MSKSTSAATECGQSVIEFLSLGIVAAKKLRMNTLPIDLNMAQSILDLLRNPPQESIPSGAPLVSPIFEPLPHELSPPPMSEWKGCTRKSAACEQGVCICRPIPATRLTDAEVSARVRPRNVSASEQRALKDAGRGWHQGM